MVLANFGRALVVGLAIAAVVGPISLLIIRRTLERGWAAGMRSGLGAGTADGLYGGLAAFGVGAVTGALVAGQVWLRLIGGLFLCYLGIAAWRAPPATAPATVAGRLRGLGDYGSTLGLTLTNPLTILSFAAVFAGPGLVNQGSDPIAALALALGVGAGSALWWLILTGGAAALRDRLAPGVLRGITRASGLAILGFGVVEIAGALLSFRR